jgi:Ca-activated chloride channel family protein
MNHALTMLSSQDMSSRRILIFTDGHTFDEDKCQELAQQFGNRNIPITALGIGDYEENLLIHLSDTTGGRVLHVIPENNEGTAVSINDLPNQIIEDFSQAQQSVITNLALTVKTVQGVQLTRVVRAYPELAEFPLNQEDSLPIGNATAKEETVFLLEFTADSRPASRVRLAQIALTYDVPGKNRRGEFPPQNVVVQFVEGQMGAAVNQEVSAYLQQCNIAGLIKKATELADVDPVKTQKLLETARNMTVKLGNSKMTRVLDNVQQELNSTGTISLDSRKTVVVGSKGKTIAWSGDPNTDEDKFRQISGT